MKIYAAAAFSAAVFTAPAVAQDSETLAAARDVFARYQDACMADGGLLWGKVLCGPLMAYDQDARVVYANVPDGEGRLTWRDGVWVGTAEEGDAPPYSNTSADWAGVHWAVIRDQDLKDGPGPVRLGLHENFHRIQPDLALPYEDGPMNEHLDERDGRLWLRLELRALTAAIQADDAAGARAALHDALAFRALRYRAFPNAEARERSLEYHEGLPEYTGWRLAEKDLTVADLVADLERKEAQPSFARGFAYATGPAMGVALDRAGVRWIPMLRSPDATFLSIGASAFAGEDPRDASDAAAVEAAKAYGYDALLAEETERAETLAAKRADFMARFVEGPRLSTPMGYMSFDPNSVTTLGDHGQVYETLKIGGGWGEIETASGGLLAWNEGRAFFDRREVEGEGPWKTDAWTLTLADGWTLKEDGGDLRVVEIAD